MTREPRFFPYDPRPLRIALFLCAVACAALAAWSLAQARETGAISAWARLGTSFGLLGAFGVMFWRIRPREGWGVGVTRLGLTVSRPLSGNPIELDWSDVSGVRREGRRRERLVVIVKPEGRLLLQQHLFSSRAAFESLVDAVELNAPPPRHDA
ncbi:MAG: hypothetical protein WBV82_01850 [Myxococcaceae bacterium]